GDGDLPRTQHRRPRQRPRAFQRRPPPRRRGDAVGRSPASIGLILIREPAIRLLFQHGQIDAHSATLIGSSLYFYAGAIWAFSLLQNINRAYYAIHDTVTPLVMAIVNIVINLVVEIPLLWWLGEAGMAVGT